MVLKEAYRYLRYLADQLQTCGEELRPYPPRVKEIKLHKRNIVDPYSEDFTEEVVTNPEVKDVTRLIQIGKALITEHGDVSDAVKKAKNKAGDPDYLSVTNKLLREFAHNVSLVSDSKPMNRIEHARGYKENSNGDLIPYDYKVEVTQEIAFDKKAARDEARSLNAKADAVSVMIDGLMSGAGCVVEFTPKFDVNSSFEDIYDEFV